jgi:hypothetical protein
MYPATVDCGEISSNFKDANGKIDQALFETYAK